MDINVIRQAADFAVFVRHRQDSVNFIQLSLKHGAQKLPLIVRTCCGVAIPCVNEWQRLYISPHVHRGSLADQGESLPFLLHPFRRA